MMRRLFLPIMLPAACAWIAAQERRILVEGVPLNPVQFADARALGVADPGRVRVLCLDRLPLPVNPFVQRLGLWTGLLSRQTSGLSARYGIYLRAPLAKDRALLAHELVHTRQYEKLGGIRPFLRRYLHECLTVGYHASDMEWEASDAASRLCD